MKKIIINRSYHSFCLSHKAIVRLRDLGQPDALREEDRGAHWPAAAGPREPRLNQYGVSIPRDDRDLVRVVEELGSEANGHCADLKVVLIPDDIAWTIDKTDGLERVSEAHRTWQ